MRKIDTPPMFLKPRLIRGFDADLAAVTPAEFFVLSRVDGSTSLKDLVALSGLPEGAALVAIRRLWSVGAFSFPGISTPRPAPAIDPALLVEDVDLSLPERRAILGKLASLEGATPAEILEVDADAQADELAQGYRAIAKAYHPDRHRSKRLGTYLARLERIFAAATEAYDALRKG